MNNFKDTIKSTPVVVPKSVRRDDIRLLTSGYGGKNLPLGYIPLLREDSCSGNITFNFEMMETAEMLMNAVNVTVFAHLVPMLALERFKGSMDRLNRSYSGIYDDPSDPDFFDTHAPDPATQTDRVYGTMGMHWKDEDKVNTAVLEAYNAIYNFRAKARSKHLPLRTNLTSTLAPAFWNHTDLAHIVPDFDQAAIDGEVPLNIVSGSLPVRGLGILDGVNPTAGPVEVIDQRGDRTYQQHWTDAQGLRMEAYKADPADPWTPRIFAEMQENGVTVSLSNIEMAKQTRAFAEMRAAYRGVSEEHVIDLLMQGIRVPEEQMSQPILLGRQSTIFGLTRRYASDGDNLSKSVSNGMTSVSMNVRTPPINTGGVIMFTAEIVPEQLFERKKDYFFYAQAPDDLPNAQNDYLDPEKVSIVPNAHVDVLHSDPDGTFGYAPLNHQWKRNLVRVGGKYLRPEVNAGFDEDRQKIWASESVDPALTEDFYLVNDLHHKVFASSNEDPFEISARGSFNITGNTVFGRGLEEASDDYQTILDGVDQTRLDKPEGGVDP